MSAHLLLASSILTMATWPTIDDSALAPSREQAQRLLANPVLRLTARNLPERRISFRLGGRTVAGVRQSCAGKVAIMRSMAAADAPVTLILEDQRDGRWVILEAAITPTAFTDDGEVAQADVQATLSRVQADSGPRIGIVRRPGRGTIDENTGHSGQRPVTGSRA